jgi:hypothetical protein
MSLRESEGLKELWDIDFSLGNLSPRRQSCKTGWINELEENGGISIVIISAARAYLRSSF